MKMIIDVLTVILPFFYLVTVIAYGYAFIPKKPAAKKFKTPLLITTIVVHLLYIILRTIYFVHPPIISVFEILSLLAFSIAASYRIIEIRTGIKNTGFLILLLSLIFQTISSLFIQDLYEVNPILRNNLLGIHVLSALIGYSAFTISAVYGLMYLLQYHNLKTNTLGIFFDNLPNLERLEHLTHNAITVGFLLLTIAIIIGVAWLPHAFEEYSFLDPKLLGTLLVWIMYGVGLFMIKRGKRTGKQIMKLAISGFLVSIFSLTIINLYFSSFHNFF